LPTKITDNTVKYHDARVKTLHAATSRAFKRLGRIWQNEAKRIVTDEAFDTGEFAASVRYEFFEEGDLIGFRGMDGVKYGIYIEKGTVKHFVPFYRWTGNGYDVNDPVLADWGHRVLGLTPEEMLAMGGIQVSNDELRPFMRAMLHTQAVAADEFRKAFKRIK
jgi:hypothetical protein